MDRYLQSDTVRRRMRRISRGQRTEEAVGFLQQFAFETGQDPVEHKARLREVKASLRRTGHYDHTPAELTFGARVAWRNHARCIGRVSWKALKVHDCRNITDVEGIMAETVANMEEAYRGGNIGSSISIFAPATPNAVPATFVSPQVLQYAGYIDAKGRVTGDRLNVELTRRAASLGWDAPEQQGQFDLLPTIMRDAAGKHHAFELDPAVAHEIAIEHPEFPGLSQLGLRWYGVPCVANMVLTIGGIDYPCAPFNGYYMCTEIGSRNLLDPRRYDLMEPIARAFGFDPDPADNLWQDRTMTELNRAVIASFEAAGIRMIDHHEASRFYLEFMQQEQRAGRTPSGEWSWIVPPQASAACPVFHLPMTNLNAVPNFYTSRHADGGELYLDRTHIRESSFAKRYERWKRRWRDWRRKRDRVWHRA